MEKIYPKGAKPLDEFNEKEQNKKLMNIVRDISEMLRGNNS